MSDPHYIAEVMQLINRKATTYLIVAQVAALSVGYILRSPDLSATARTASQHPSPAVRDSV
jgi:hypothetical protein